MADLKWWQTAVFYQIYPRSFSDGNGDGLGDFIGMAQKLDYLKDLGVQALWLSPHFPSPQFDVGYDIADYVNVAPEYGTLDDFKKFLDEAHQRGLRVILDLVLNHTSHLHQWFIESRTSRDNPKSDWYLWRDGQNGGPPNNWMAPFGGSAWEYEPARDQYYYHFFLKEQPDLNWRNPEVKQAMWAAVRFWLELGVDGYRLDAIGTIFERPDLPNHTCQISQAELQPLLNHGFPDGRNPQATELWESMYKDQYEQPGVHELMQELRALVDEYPDKVLVGENDDVRYYGDGSNELHMAFNFPLMNTTRLTPAWIRANQQARLSALPPGAWPCNTLNNHDTSRMFSRYGDGENNEAIARTSLALMLTLRGTPFLYNGEEIGMSDFHQSEITLFRDPPAVWLYEKEITSGKAPAAALAIAAADSRDRCRTPMPWAKTDNAGFSPKGVQTWLPVHPNYLEGVNVAEQQDNPASLLNFYKHLLHLRQRTPALIEGTYTALHTTASEYFAFLRQTENQTCLVVLNLSAQTQTVKFELASHQPIVRCLFSNHKTAHETYRLNALDLPPFEVFIGELLS